MSNATRRIVTTRMTLDLNIPDIQRDITVTQGDTNRLFEITLVDSGHPYVLDANDKWTVIMTGVKPSGATLNNGCDVAGGKILYDFALGNQIATEAGAFSVQFNIYDKTGEVIATPKIWVTVTPNANRDAVIKDQYTVLSTWLEQLNEYGDMEAARDERVDEKIKELNDSEDVRKNNETDRVNAEKWRESEETKRDDAEKQRESNEAERQGLQQQVNNLLNVPEGSTTADLALYDLKLGADGVTYETPGIAVRTQLGRLQGKVPEIDKRLANVESLLDPQLFVEDTTVSAVKSVPATAAPYAKVLEIGGMTYKEGNTLRSAAVTEVESVGAQLIPFPYASGGAGYVSESNGVKISVLNDGGIDFSGTPTGYVGFVVYNGALLSKGEQVISLQGTFNGIYAVLYLYDSNDSEIAHFSLTSTNNSVKLNMGSYPSAASMNLTIARSGEGISTRGTVYPMLNRGTTAQPYAPYVRHTLPIPEAVRTLDGYGWGVNANCYNYIDWEKKQFVKRVGCVDLGTFEWSTDYGLAWTTALVNTAVPDVGLCNKYDVIPETAMDNAEDKTIQIRADILYVKDASITDATAFKAAMAGVMLYYELAEPVVTDISDLLPEDKYIGVEGGGTVTMVNEYSLDMPNKVRYQLKRS